MIVKKAAVKEFFSNVLQTIFQFSGKMNPFSTAAFLYRL